MSAVLNMSASARGDLPGHRVILGTERKLLLDCGVEFGPFALAYQTYGRLNAERSNAILVCHALTGDQFVAEEHPVTGKAGWWATMVGPGLPLDTDRYFIICANVLGGCMGSSGPRSISDGGEGLWGTEFPPITIKDMVQTKGMPTRMGSMATNADGPWTIDAPVSAHLRAAGTVG